MALKQTRRGVSLNRDVYSAAKDEAEKRCITLAHFVENCIRSEIVLPTTVHASIESARRATIARAKFGSVSNGGDIVRRVSALRRSA